MNKSKLDQLLSFAMAAVKDMAAIKKPYDRRDAADLTEAQRERIATAEMAVYKDVTSVVGYTHDPDVKDTLNELRLSVGDETLIDSPLGSLKALAKSYAETGLAADEAKATRMAEAYKISVADHQRQKIQERGV